MEESAETGVQTDVADPGVGQDQTEQNTQADDKDYNWQQLRYEVQAARHEKELERKQREMLEQRLAEMQKASQPQEPEHDPEDFATYADLKKIQSFDPNKMSEWLEQELQKRKAQEQAEQAPKLMQQKYSDFNAVVNPETIEKLRVTHPDVFNNVVSVGNEMYKLELAYKEIKQHLFKKSDQPVPPPNKAPIQTATSQVGSSPLANAHNHDWKRYGLSPEMQKQLWSEMNK